MPPLSQRLCALLTPEVVASLKQNGVRTVADLVSLDVVQLSRRTGIPPKDLTTIRRSLLYQFAPHPITASDLWRETEASAALIPTGCRSIDELLDGGLLTGELTEITGPPASGKTQLCLSVAVQVAMATSSSVVLVDSGGAVSSLRLQEMLHARGGSEKDTTAVLERIRVFRVFSVYDVLTLVHSVGQRIAQQVDAFHSSLRVLIIDSITPLLSPFLGGHQTHGHTLMSHLAASLKSLAHDHFLAITYTNNMVSDTTSRDGLKPALGRTWSHTPHTRLTLHIPPSAARETPRGRERIATLSKSQRQPTGIATGFIITEAGLTSTYDYM